MNGRKRLNAILHADFGGGPSIVVQSIAVHRYTILINALKTCFTELIVTHTHTRI